MPSLLLVAFPLMVMASEEGLSSGGVSVQILGQSGKMTLTSESMDVDVTISMDSLYELDADGNKVGGGGPPSGKHSLQTFAPQDFTIDSNPTRDEIDGIPVDKINFETSLVDDAATFKVTTWVFLGSGTIEPSDEDAWDVGNGTIKFSIDIADWPFCDGEGGNPCQGETGEYLELTIEMKSGSDDDLEESDDSNLFSMGNNITLTLSNQVQVDDEWTTMPSGYPKLVTEGSKKLFQFRFPKFASSVYYDPLIGGLTESSSLVTFQKKKDENDEMGLTPLHIGLIAGGGALVLLIGIALYCKFCRKGSSAKFAASGPV